MPFEDFKSRVRIVKEEAVVKKWIEDQSFKTEYICLNVPEALQLGSREEVEKHFREVHLPNIIKQVESHTVSGSASRLLRSPALQRLVRAAWDEQKRFPLKIATILSQQFAGHGLQFFKVNKTITHVSVARPHFLDLEATPVSDQVKRIVQFINAKPKSTRRSLVDALAPAPAAAPMPPPLASAPTEAPAEGAPPQPPAVPTEVVPTPEQASLIGDLHWLIHQGHVIEFANGILETAKRPLPRPPRPPKPEVKAAPATATELTPGPVDAPTEDEAPADDAGPVAEVSTAPEVSTLPAEAAHSEPASVPATEPLPEPQAPAVG
jgi:hypothetical protein